MTDKYEEMATDLWALLDTEIVSAIGCLEPHQDVIAAIATVLKQAADEARAEEREACAEVVDEEHVPSADEPDAPDLSEHNPLDIAIGAVVATKKSIAAAIRARKP